MEDALKKALDVKERAIAMLDERRREFYSTMIVNSGDALEIMESEGRDERTVEALDVDTLYELYHREDVYDAIWLSTDGLAEDNVRHEDDDYNEGFENGAAMVLGHLHDVFGIEPEVEA